MDRTMVADKPGLDTGTSMIRGVYEISEREIKRYIQHGMAIISFTRMRPYPNDNGFISLKPLLDAIGKDGANPKVGKPTEAWVQRSEIPAIMISSGLQGSKATKSHIMIDTNRETTMLRFEYCRKVSDNQVLLEPIYRV